VARDALRAGRSSCWTAGAGSCWWSWRWC
jgi:hypothetical protein